MTLRIGLTCISASSPADFRPGSGIHPGLPTGSGDFTGLPALSQEACADMNQRCSPSISGPKISRVALPAAWLIRSKNAPRPSLWRQQMLSNVAVTVIRTHARIP